MKNKRLLGLSAAFALTLAIGVTSCKKDKMTALENLPNYLQTLAEQHTSQIKL